MQNNELCCGKSNGLNGSTANSIEPAPAVCTFYRRALPDHLHAFTSTQGRELFRKSLAAGTAECYFALASNFTMQSDPAFCGPGSLAMVLNALSVDPGRTWKGVWRWYADEMLDWYSHLTQLQTARRS
jgi:Phytochelatin synthase